MINIDQALTIDGWMSPQELIWLARQAEKHQCIAEVGSYLGRSTRALAEHTPGVVYAIDDWYGPRDVDWLKPEDRELCFKKFLMNMRGLETKIRIVNTNHALASISKTPDMVFIDGDHEYESVVWDIQRWLPRVAKGGLICGHDANHLGVIKALREVFGIYKVEPDTTIWYKEL